MLIPLVLHAQEEFVIADHPRLLLKAGEEKLIAGMIAQDPVMNKIHTAILSECDKMIDLPVLERVMKGKRLLHTSREAIRRIFWLSYSYRMTGNEAYAERAVKEMLTVCAFTDWNPSHFLDVGEMVMAVSIGYDWLYPRLTQEQKRTIKDAIVEKGFLPADDERYAGFYNLDNNWNQVCCGGLQYGALATYEDHPQLAKELTDVYVKSVPFALSVYAPDGGYPEGFHYWGYGTSFQVMMIAALESALGTDFGLSDSPGFLESSVFVQFMTAPGGVSYNFSDAPAKSPCNPMMFWFAAKTGDMSRVWLERRNLENLPDDFMADADELFSEYRLLPSLLIFCSKLQMGTIRPPEDNSRYFRGKTPVYIYREGWDSKDDAYLGVKGGSPLTSHSHMDAGSFVYEYGGVRWSCELGMQDYFSLESRGVRLWDGHEGGQRWEVFRIGNESHSTLTLNGGHHLVKSFAPIVATWSERSRKGAVVDLSTTFAHAADSVVRSVWLDRRNHLHVTDFVGAAGEDVEVMWVMTTPAEAEILTDGRILLEKEGKRMVLEISSDDAVPHIWSNDPPHDYDAPNPGTRRVGFIISVPAGASSTFEVTLTPSR